MTGVGRFLSERIRRKLTAYIKPDSTNEAPMAQVNNRLDQVVLEARRNAEKRVAGISSAGTKALFVGVWAMCAYVYA